MNTDAELKYLVVGKLFDEQEEAENYARTMTNSVSSKVWINVMLPYQDKYCCIKSYTL